MQNGRAMGPACATAVVTIKCCKWRQMFGVINNLEGNNLHLHNMPLQKKNKRVRQQACKSQIPPYSLSQRRRPQLWASLHAAADVAPCPPANALVRQGRSSNQPYHSYGSRVGLCSAKRVFVPGDLDLWPPKGDKTCPDSRPTRMQNFMPLAFSAAEKSVTVQRNKPPPHHNRFMALFPGPSRSASARKLLDFTVQGKSNTGRHTDHPAGHYSIRTNQCPPLPSPNMKQKKMTKTVN